MTLMLSPTLKKKLTQRAKQRRLSPEELVQEAVAWYLQMDVDLADELEAWQEIHDEANRLVEESAK